MFKKSIEQTMSSKRSLAEDNKIHRPVLSCKGKILQS